MAYIRKESKKECINVYIELIHFSVHLKPNTTIVNQLDANKNFKEGICTPVFIAAPFTIARTWKQFKCPSPEEWIKNVLHIYGGMLHHKKEQNNAIWGNMDCRG